MNIKDECKHSSNGNRKNRGAGSGEQKNSPTERILATIDPDRTICPLCNSITSMENTWGELPHRSRNTDMLRSALIHRLGRRDHMLKFICVECILQEQKDAWW